MRLRRRFAAVTVALTLALGSVALSATAEAHRRPPKPKDVQLQVLSFNDFHGHLQPPGGPTPRWGRRSIRALTPVGGAEYLASTLDRLRAKATNSQTVTAGDLIGGTPFLSGAVPRRAGGGVAERDGPRRLRRRQPRVRRGRDGAAADAARRLPSRGRLLRAVGRSAATPVPTSRGWPPTWSASATGRTVLPGTWVTKVNGVKVGYIGMTLEDTPTLVSQSGIQGIEFRDEVETANRAARDLRRRGVETIIVLLHEGGLQTGTYQQCTGVSGPIVNIAEEAQPVDRPRGHRAHASAVHLQHPRSGRSGADGHLGLLVRSGGHRDHPHPRPPYG